MPPGNESKAIPARVGDVAGPDLAAMEQRSAPATAETVAGSVHPSVNQATGDGGCAADLQLLATVCKGRRLRLDSPAIQPHQSPPEKPQEGPGRARRRAAKSQGHPEALGGPTASAAIAGPSEVTPPRRSRRWGLWLRQSEVGPRFIARRRAMPKGSRQNLNRDSKSRGETWRAKPSAWRFAEVPRAPRWTCRASGTAQQRLSPCVRNQ
jgi:hypothetical protein